MKNTQGFGQAIGVGIIVASIMSVVIYPLWGFFTSSVLNHGKTLLYSRFLDTVAIKASLGYSDELVQRFYLVAWSFGLVAMAYVWSKVFTSSRELSASLEEASKYGLGSNCDQTSQLQQDNPKRDLHDLIQKRKKRVNAGYKLMLFGGIVVFGFFLQNLYAFFTVTTANNMNAHFQRNIEVISHVDDVLAGELKFDWATMESFEDYENILRKIEAVEWVR